MSDEIAKQAAISTLKTAISLIPIVGPTINEYAIEARGRIKQDRVNKFVNEFAKYIQEHQKVQLNIEQIEKEEFGDFFEEIIIGVSKNHSIAKKDAFKKLLFNQLVEPKPIDYAELFCGIISNLHEKQILILCGLSEASTTYNDLQIEILEKKTSRRNLKMELDIVLSRIYDRDDLAGNPDISQLEDKMESLDNEIQQIIARLKPFASPFLPETYKATQHEFYYLIQDLCTKGLLIDIGTANNAQPFEVFEISQLGYDLLESIK